MLLATANLVPSVGISEDAVLAAVLDAGAEAVNDLGGGVRSYLRAGGVLRPYWAESPDWADRVVGMLGTVEF